MKNLRSVIVLFILSIFSISSVNALNTINLEKALYKDAILSMNKITQDYQNWEEINRKIERIFILHRYNKDINAIKDLQNLLKSKIVELNSKTSLTRNDRILLNLYSNIFYRTVLLLNYQLN